MSRPEKAIDGTGSIARFAQELRALKQRAGLTYRGLSARAHVCPSALSRAASGRKRPSWEVTRAFVEGCGGDVLAWQVRWESLPGGAS
ncbi:helix-turn-helix domain-containing protein [Actinophytocola sp.]|uniref:helix-turn-helix domain-containing protein n=1 Tax=Actinophytocola sp. TaxID=1872138 RepID=UPI0039C87DD0